MIPRLVPEISPLDALCDVIGVVVVGVVGIGDSWSWMTIFVLRTTIVTAVTVASCFEDLLICVSLNPTPE